MDNVENMLFEMKEIWENNLLSVENEADYYYCKGALFIIKMIITLLPLFR
jgi:hypothetical protein